MQAVNRAWVEGRPEEATPLMHADVVFVAPGFAAHLPGPDAVIGSYREFSDAATIHGYDESEPRTYVAGPTAVVTYRWTLDYTMGDERLVESGHDLFVLVGEEDSWLVAWRTLLPDPSTGPPAG